MNPSDVKGKQRGGEGKMGSIFREYGLLISRRVRHTIPPWWCPEIADNRHRAEQPENQPHVVFSGQNGQVING
jgi:hypothetical protein